VAYNSLLLKRRKQIHEKIGKAIEELYPDRLEEFCEALAHHYSTAEDWEKAFQYLRLSAGKAHRSYATQEAFTYYTGALSALKQLPDTEQNKRNRVDTTMSMPSVVLALSFPEGSAEVLEEGLKAAEELGDRGASVQLYAFIGNAHTYAGNFTEGLKFAQKAFEEAEKLGDVATLSSTAVRLGVSYFSCGEAAKLVDLATRAITLLERSEKMSGAALPQFDLYVTLLYMLGSAKSMLGYFDEGESLCQKALRHASQTQSQYALANAHMGLLVVSLLRGKPEVLLHHAQEVTRLSEEVQIPFFLGSCRFFEGYGHYYQGDFAVARESIASSIRLMLEHDVRMVLSPAYTLSGIVSQALGDLGKARSALEEAVKVARESNAKHYEGYARICLGRLVIEEDTSRVAEAEQMILEGLRMVEGLQVRPFEAWGYLHLGETYAIAGQRDKAFLSLKKAHEMGQEMGMDYWLARTEKALENLKA
jgi:tetratricopeptide (TPR) repeat protein